MNTKFTLMANGDSGKSLTLKTLQYLLLANPRIKIKEATRYIVIKNKIVGTRSFSNPNGSHFTAICPGADLYVLNIITYNNHEVGLLICSKCDDREQVECNWDVYTAASQKVKDIDFVFISPCHYRAKKEYDKVKPTEISFDTETRIRNREGFCPTPLYDFILSAQKYCPHMDVCVYQKGKSIVKSSATFKLPLDTEVNKIVAVMNTLPKNPFLKSLGKPAPLDIQQNAVHRALILLQELKRFFL